MGRSVEGTEVDFHLLSEDTRYLPFHRAQFEDKLSFSRPFWTQAQDQMPHKVGQCSSKSIGMVGQLLKEYSCRLVGNWIGKAVRRALQMCQRFNHKAAGLRRHFRALVHFKRSLPLITPSLLLCSLLCPQIKWLPSAASWQSAPPPRAKHNLKPQKYWAWICFEVNFLTIRLHRCKNKQ